MARLPQPGGDNGNWGTVLNDYLNQSLKSDGTLKDSVVSSINLAPGAVTSSKIAADAVTATQIQDGTITEAQLHQDVQTKLNSQPSTNSSLRPLGSSYRPLRGNTQGIGSAIAAGSDSTGVVTTDWKNRAGKYRFVGMNPTPYTPFPDFAINDNTGLLYNGSIDGENTVVVEFWSDATEIRVFYYVTDRTDVWALVDDARITNTYQHANFTDSNATWTLTQSQPVWRKWRLCLPITTFHGIGINAGARIAETTKGFQLCIIGDSYVQGGISIQNAVAPGTWGVIASGNPIGEFEQETGLDIWRCGVSGSGYVNGSSFGAAGTYGSNERMTALATLPQMDAIIVWGTPNDEAASLTQITDAANAMWTAIQAARPGTPLIIAGVECSGKSPAKWAQINSVLKAAAEAHPGVTAFIDFREHSWMTGTGNEGSPTGDGNSDVFLSSDDLHLTHPGNRWWGQNVARLLSSTLIPADQTGGSF